MGLEAATYISELVTTNPVGASDQVSAGDDHIRMLKSVLQTVFPNASKAFAFPGTSAKNANFSVASTEQNTTFFVTTTGGSVTATLPSLAAGDAGWECFLLKITTDVNPVFIAPVSGTIQSGEYGGLAKTRRCIPGRRTRVLWSGTGWVAERVECNPIGTVLDNWLAATPVGYEPANGTALSSSANYPDYNAAKGGLTVPDCRGRVVAGLESTASRLTAAVSGVDGATLGNVGGLESFTLATANLPSHTHGPGSLTGFTSTDGSHNHDYENQSNNNTRDNSGGTAIADDANIGHTTSTDGNHSHDVSVDSGVTGSTGSGTAKGFVQPTIVLRKIIVVE